MSKNNKNLTQKLDANLATESSTSKYLVLEQKLAEAQQQQAILRGVAEEAASKLIKIEDLLNLQVGRKPKFWNVLFHFSEVLAVIQEAIKIIKEFKEKYMSPQQAAKEDGSTK